MRACTARIEADGRTKSFNRRLKAAVFRHFQGASWQRCQVHYARNLLGMVGAARRKELAADLRAIFFAATSREQALGVASSVAQRWREKGNEKVAEHIEEHIERYMCCPMISMCLCG